MIKRTTFEQMPVGAIFDENGNTREKISASSAKPLWDTEHERVSDRDPKQDVIWLDAPDEPAPPAAGETGPLVTELRAKSEACSMFRYDEEASYRDAADIAAKHEAQWQAERDAWQAKEERLRALVMRLRSESAECAEVLDGNRAQALFDVSGLIEEALEEPTT